MYRALVGARAFNNNQIGAIVIALDIVPETLIAYLEVVN